MDNHDSKIVVTIVITVIFCLYYILYFMVLLAALPGIISKLLFGIIPIGVMGAMIYVCVQRINEIRSGELKAYNQMMDKARALANKRMIQQAESLGADAIVNVRYATSAIMAGAAEVMAYGTAVKFVNNN